MKRYLFIFLFFISSSSVAVQIEVAFSNYFNKKYDLAMEQFLQLAALGSKEAQYQIGVLHVRGEGADKDPATGYAWIKLSTSGPKAYEKAIPVEPKLKALLSKEDLSKSLSIFEEIQGKYGDDAVEKRTTPRLGTKASSGFSKALILRSTNPIYPMSALDDGYFGNVQIEFTIGRDGRVKYPFVIQATGEKFNKSSLNAIKQNIYIPAQIGTQPVASYSRHFRYFFELSEYKVRQKRLKKILQDLQTKAAKHGSLDMYRYAINISSLQRYLPEDFQESLDNPNKWFQSSAVNGFSPAKYRLGNNLLYGEQCHSDFDKSCFWLESAAQDGLVQAQMMIGLERLNGVRFEKDIEAGIEWLRKAAKNYDPAKVELVKALILTSEQPNLDELAVMLEEIDYKSFEDKISILEVKLMIAKLQENETVQKRLLKNLKKHAKKLDLPYEQLVTNIDRVINGQAPIPLNV